MCRYKSLHHSQCSIKVTQIPIAASCGLLRWYISIHVTKKIDVTSNDYNISDIYLHYML